jgi:hypothetical protein
MLRETKFGYGFLLVGTGVPYLIDRVLGLSYAIFVSVACVVVGGAFLFAGHLQKNSEGRSKWKLGEILALSAALGTLVILISLGILRVMPKTESWSSDSRTIGTKSTEQPPIHTLLVRYSESTLPIRIAPKDTAYILQLNPNISEWVWEIPNPGQKSNTWPSDLHLKKGGPPGDFIYACELTNDEDKTFLDVSVNFEVSFHELEMVAVTVTKNKDGTQSVALPRPGTDHVVVTLGHSKETQNLTAARDGAVVKKFTHSVSAPSISPRSTARIYLVNQSSLISKFTFPGQATAIVSGNAQRIKVALIRPNVTVVDAMPWFGLGPSTYHWKGVPGAP